MNWNKIQDMSWSKISLVLCIFGFLKEFRPSEPFVTDYLTGKWKNFTVTQVSAKENICIFTTASSINLVFHIRRRLCFNT